MPSYVYSDPHDKSHKKSKGLDSNTSRSTDPILSQSPNQSSKDAEIIRQAAETAQFVESQRIYAERVALDRANAEHSAAELAAAEATLKNPTPQGNGSENPENINNLELSSPHVGNNLKFGYSPGRDQHHPGNHGNNHSTSHYSHRTHLATPVQSVFSPYTGNTYQTSHMGDSVRNNGEQAVTMSQFQGLPVNEMMRTLEQHLGVGYFHNQIRELPHTIPAAPQNIYSNGADQVLSGRISVGTPKVTQRIIQKTKAYLTPSRITTYVPRKTIEWVMQASNPDGFDLYAEIPEAKCQDGKMVYDIRQTMVDVLCIHYPNTVATITYQKHIPIIKDSEQKAILTGGDLRAWLSDLQKRYANSFPNILKALFQVDPINDANTQKTFSTLLADDVNSSHKQARDYLEAEITHFNFSSLMIAKHIRKVIKLEIALYSDMIHLISVNTEIENNGIGLFYMMKDLILSASSGIAKTYDHQLRSLRMAFAGYPKWMEYVDDVIRLRHKLSCLQCYINDDILYSQFMSEFHRVMIENLGEKAMSDNLYQQFFLNKTHQTWNEIITLISFTRRQEYYLTRIEDVKHEELAYQAVGTPIYNAQIQQATAAVQEKTYKWDETSLCPIHNNSHSNKMCRRQTDIRSDKKLNQSTRRVALDELLKKITTDRDRTKTHVTNSASKSKAPYTKGPPDGRQTKKPRVHNPKGTDTSSTPVTANMVVVPQAAQPSDIVLNTITLAEHNQQMAIIHDKPYDGPTFHRSEDDCSFEEGTDSSIDFTEDPNVTEFTLTQKANKRDRALPFFTSITPEERACRTSVPHLYSTVDPSTKRFIPGALGNKPLDHPEDDQIKADLHAKHLATKIADAKRARQEAETHAINNQGTYDSDEEYKSLLSVAHLTDEPGSPTSKRTKLINVVETYSNNDKAYNVAPYLTPTDEVSMTGILKGKSLKQYAMALVFCNTPAVVNRQCPKREAKYHEFLDAFNAFNSESIKRSGTLIHIGQYISNWATLTKMVRGFPLDEETVNITTTRTIPLTHYLGPCAGSTVSALVVLVKLSQAARSATLSSYSSIVGGSKGIDIINAIVNIDTISHTSPSIANNIARYDTIVDTGASAHVVRSTLLGTNICTQSNRNVALGDNSITLQITHTCDIGILQNAMVVPKITLNLISGGRLDKQGYSMKFANGRGTIRKGRHIIRCILHNGLYFCNLKDFLTIPETVAGCNHVQLKRTKLPEAVRKRTMKHKVSTRLITPASKPKFKAQRTISTNADLELIHKRFGHANIESIVKGLKDRTIKGYDVALKRGLTGKFELPNGTCECCMLSKSHLPSFPNSSTVKGRAPGEYVVCDIQGPFSIESMGGERYVLTYTDFYSRHSWTYLLTQKSEALTHLKHLVEVVFKAARIELRHYHSDGAGELTGAETRQYLEKTVHATISVSEVYTPARNSIAERKFRTLGEMAKAILFDSSLPPNFWGYAYLTANYLRNRIPITTGDGITKTPYELWTGHVPSVRHLRRWGCKCYAHIPKAKRTKDFSYKCHIGYLIGYTDENSYLVYVPLEKKVIKPTVAVVFDERVPDPIHAYFDELTKHDYDEVTDPSVSKDPKYYENLLVGQKYFDPDDLMYYVTTRIAVTRNIDKHIVAYRVPLLSNNMLSRREEPSPIHAADVVRMVADYPKHLLGSQNALSDSQNTLDDISDRSQSPLVLSRSKQRLISKVKKAQPTSIPATSDIPLDSLEEPTTLVNRYRENLKRSRIQRLPLNVRELGNVSNHVITDTDDSFESIYNQVYISAILKELDDTPKNYKAAKNSPQSKEWRAAIDAEIASLEGLKTWNVVDIPKKCHLKTGAFIFKKKYTGSEIKYKARLVAHGYRQIYGLDYTETYAPVTSTTSIRTILALAANNNMLIHQMDIDTAFLNADLEEDIFMKAPDGIVLPEGKCLHLKKSLYGLKQSPRNFNLDLDRHIISMGFKRTVSDACVYTNTINGHTVTIAIYVDDLIIACCDLATIIGVKAQVAERYKVKDMGEMDWYLGMRYTRNAETGTITLDQSKYTQDVLDRFSGYFKSQAYRDVPMMGNSILEPWTNDYDNNLTDEQLVNIAAFPYRQVVGSLLYLAVWTRPDIQYAIIAIAKHSHYPTLEAIRACKWLLEYLNCTKDRRLEFHRGANTLSGFVDSSFGDCTITRKSTCGNIIYLGTSPISWDSFIPKTTVALSTAEAEYTAAHYCAKTLCGHNNLLTELGYPQSKIILYEDNQASIQMAIQIASTHRTKHIAIHIHHLRDLIETKFIDMVYISTKIQLADVFTKALAYQAFSVHVDTLFGIPPVKQLKEYLHTISMQRRQGISVPTYRGEIEHYQEEEEENN